MGALTDSGMTPAITGRKGRRGQRIALLLGFAAAGLLAAAVPLALVAHQLTFSNSGSFVVCVVCVPFALVGAVVASRRPSNPIGWLLLALGVLVLFCFDASMYAVLRYRLGYTDLPLGPLAVFLAPAWVPLVVLLPLPVALFPDGRMTTRKWHATLWLYGAVSLGWLGELAVVEFDAIALRPIHVDSSGIAVLVDSPTGNWASAASATKPLLIPFFALGLLWIARQVNAYRRADGFARLQLKWLFAGGTVGLTGFAVAIVAGGGTSLEATIVNDAGLICIGALPFSIGVAILRYRLYEIDRLISRTLSYALLTGLLVGIFAGLVLLTTRVLPFSSPVGVAASTLAAAALFSPLRTRLQRLVDRRFNRARYDTEAIVAAFNMRLREAVDLDTVRNELLAAVGGAVQPAHTALWIRPQPPPSGP